MNPTQPILTLSLAGLLSGCASFSSESAGADTMTAHVGNYDPPPTGIQKLRVGVPQFEVASGVTGEVSTLAADQLTTLAVRTKRFITIERAQLKQLLAEQGLKGVVRGSEIAKSGAIRGVDYLLLGKVTNMRVKQEKSSGGFGLGNIPIPGTRRTLGAFDYKNNKSQIKVDCGVDLRLVNTSSGEILVANSSEYSRKDTIGSFGVSILGVGATSNAELKLSSNNRGKLLRLALDDAIRKILPDIDDILVNNSVKNATTPK